MKKAIPFMIIMISVILLIPVEKTTSKHLTNRSIEEKLGYIPSRKVLKAAAFDHKALFGDWLFFKVMTYYGGKIDPKLSGTGRDIEYYNMYRFLDAASFLDPYNVDVYYFTEAVFTWGIGRIKEVNRILERGLKYRTWDHYIPYFIGFNYFYFLKDYENASKYLKMVAEMTKSPFFASLASRVLYEAERTEVAISFLKTMIRDIKKESLRRNLLIRLKALEGVSYLEKAIKDFERLYKRKPKSINELLQIGIINYIPKDPYGGRFYIDKDGRVRSTSKFAFQRKDDSSNKDRKSR
jgi:tetratricopeptide (TPR) repeat protein